MNGSQSGQEPGQIKHNSYASQYLVFFTVEGRRFELSHDRSIPLACPPPERAGTPGPKAVCIEKHRQGGQPWMRAHHGIRPIPQRRACAAAPITSRPTVPDKISTPSTAACATCSRITSRRMISRASSRISIASAHSQAAGSTSWRGSPTSIRRYCTRATVSAATKTGSTIILPIARWSKSRSAILGFTP